MAKRTKQGAEKRKREDEKMTGKPVDRNPRADAGSRRQPNTTRDRGLEPADDESGRDSSQRDDLGENR